MSQDTGADTMKLTTITIGIQKNACCESEGVSSTVNRPPPKTTAFTMA